MGMNASVRQRKYTAIDTLKERKFHGTKVPRNFRSWEQKGQGAKGPGNELQLNPTACWVESSALNRPKSPTRNNRSLSLYTTTTTTTTTCAVCTCRLRKFTRILPVARRWYDCCVLRVSVLGKCNRRLACSMHKHYWNGVAVYWQTLITPLLDKHNEHVSVVGKMWKTFSNQYLLRTCWTNADATANTERTETVSLTHCMHRVQTSQLRFVLL